MQENGGGIEQLIPQEFRDNPLATLIGGAVLLVWAHREKIRSTAKELAKRARGGSSGTGAARPQGWGR